MITLVSDKGNCHNVEEVGKEEVTAVEGSPSRDDGITRFESLSLGGKADSSDLTKNPNQNVTNIFNYLN